MLDDASIKGEALVNNRRDYDLFVVYSWANYCRIRNIISDNFTQFEHILSKFLARFEQILFTNSHNDHMSPLKWVYIDNLAKSPLPN